MSSMRPSRYMVAQDTLLIYIKAQAIEKPEQTVPHWYQIAGFLLYSRAPFSARIR